MSEQTYVIDGADFTTFEEFCREFSSVCLEGHEWNGNLDAFNDFLSWPMAEDRYTLIWKNAELSRQRLGHDELVRKLNSMLKSCHPSNIAEIEARRDRAMNNEGPTPFDWLIEIINNNDDFVELRLE